VPVRFTDAEIDRLLAERKPLATDFRRRLQLRPKHGHDEREVEVKGEDGSEFLVILRRSTFNALDFSVILGVRPPASNEVFRLRRYNGKSHEHTNKIENRRRFYAFHVHQATERYQELGMQEDAFAEPTDRYSDLDSALQCMLRECGFVQPDNGQGWLFPEVLE
jgi:hypothetical protein